MSPDMSRALEVIVVCYASIAAGIATGLLAYIVGSVLVRSRRSAPGR
jgi:hypothetical protein